ncbi:hypothetical protein NQ314_012665 [Rhamnusium bicolor]|uniref:Uncharacterized protein n=1 Tax=Rhamnusium bicolor TaxID=1586634 RepID=A0AAV8XB93_9CUCU|nr:hypothetical protein NQ314_012665 [Rhamnusium bicolor]
MFALSKSIYAFEKESFYYEVVIPLLKSKGFEGSYVPKCFLCDPYIIVLEDLSLLSYKSTSKNESLDLKHCKKCLETLAKFHVEPILYELKKIEELGKNYSFNYEFRDILEDKVFSQEENGATKFMRCSIEGLFSINRINTPKWY